MQKNTAGFNLYSGSCSRFRLYGWITAAHATKDYVTVWKALEKGEMKNGWKLKWHRFFLEFEGFSF